MGAEDGLPIDHPVAQIGGMTCLMHAAAVGGNTVMDAMLAKTPDLAVRDTTGRNALHYSTRAGNHKTTQTLLAAMQVEQRE